MTKTWWHPAFCGAMKLELNDYRDVLEFQDEHQLTSGSLRIDTLIIKKLKDVVIDKNIASIFQNHNVFEYKSPEDSLDLHDYRKTHGYKLFYAAQNKIEDIQDISVTLVTSQYPYKLLEYLSNHYNVTSNQNGIYVVKHEIGLTQIVVSSELSKDENIWLTHLNKELTAARLQRLLTVAAKYSKHSALDTYLEVVARANLKTFQEVIMGKVIDQCLQELGLVDKWRNEGRIEGKIEGRVEGEAKGIVTVLKARFGKVPTQIVELINSYSDPVVLESWLELAVTCQSLKEFEETLK